MMICQQKVLTTLAFGVNMTHGHLRFEEYDEWQWTEGSEAGIGWHTARWRYAMKTSQKHSFLKSGGTPRRIS